MKITNQDILKYKYLVYKIVNRYRDLMKHNITTIDWEDVDQAGLIALYKAIENYDKSKGKFISYACASIARAVLRQIKFYDKTKNWIEIDNQGEVSMDELENNISNDIMIERITKVINGLTNITDKTRGILLLRLQGLSYSEIAEKYNISYRAVAVTMHRYKDVIRNKLLRSDI